MLLAAFKWFIQKREIKIVILKLIDGFFTGLGVVIMVILLIIALPFILLMEWLSN